jgi:hypothetical protein
MLPVAPSAAQADILGGMSSIEPCVQHHPHAPGGSEKVQRSLRIIAEQVAAALP